jgi:hypothetical protein
MTGTSGFSWGDAFLKKKEILWWSIWGETQRLLTIYL